MPIELKMEDFLEAQATIRGLVHRTPLVSSRSLSARAGCEVWLKAENLQKTGSFKPRGAFNMVRHLAQEEKARGLITASAGNHGQALAYVAMIERTPGYVVMPEKANQAKVSAVREYGATAILYGKDWDDAYARSLELAQEKKLVYVHPFKHRHIMAGQGTVALEIVEDMPDVDIVIVPIGGGGLAAGMAMALKQAQPGARMIGVEPAGSANMFASRRQGKPVKLDAVTTIADGLATRNTDPEVFDYINSWVDDLLIVSDRELIDAVRFLLERAKLLAEPAGAAAVASILSGKANLPSRSRVVAVVSGGNFDIAGRMNLGYPDDLDS